MTTPFGPVYAEHYDLFYQHKDYEAECSFLEAVFQRFAGQPVRSILDLGCGTGGHALRLAQRGYVVTGVDRSAAMLAEARQEAERSGITRTRGQAEWSGQRLEFFSGDVRSLHLDKTLAYFARWAGLELVWLCPFLELENIVDESTWNVTAVMCAIPT